MAERPIIFSAPMVLALLAGRKTQTRRVLALPKWASTDPGDVEFGDSGAPEVICRDTGCLAAVPMRFVVGDRLWVRECWASMPWRAYALPRTVNPNDPDMAAYYRADFERSGRPPWRSPIHMPRWASRLTLAVTDVRVQRLQDISEADVLAEGVEPLASQIVSYEGAWRDGAIAGSREVRTRVPAYRDLWNSIHGPGAWDANPWVVAISFTVEPRGASHGT